MRNHLYITLLLFCCKPLTAETFEDRIWKEVHDSMDQLHKRFDAIEKYMGETLPEIATDKTPSEPNKITPKKTVEISADNNFVIIKLHLGELNAQEISIETEGNSLDGKIPLKDGSANFSIQNGRLFELSIKHEQKKETQNDKDKTSFQHVEASASTKIESLPDIVANLEKTQVTYKDGIVELKLPKIAAQKKGTKLNVVTA